MLLLLSLATISRRQLLPIGNGYPRIADHSRENLSWMVKDHTFEPFVSTLPLGVTAHTCLWTMSQWLEPLGPEKILANYPTTSHPPATPRTPHVVFKGAVLSEVHPKKS